MIQGELLQKVWDRKSIDQSEALRLFNLPLEELGALADRRRQLAKADAYAGRGNETVTYIVDRNVIAIGTVRASRSAAERACAAETTTLARNAADTPL